MTPESAQRRDKVLALMAEYIDLGHGLADAESDRLLAEMAWTKAKIDELLDAERRANQLQ